MIGQDGGLSLLLLGGTGQVGREVRLQAGPGDRVIAPGRDAVDLTDGTALARLVAETPCDVVVNAAAYTAVDRAESEPDLAAAVNAEAPRHLARACAATGRPLFHISTDYVFDGTKAGPYVEDDPVAPLGVYGVTKEAGERAVRETLDRHIVLRTSWVFGGHGANFVRTMLRLAGERPELRVVDDQTGCPTAAGDIAAALWTLARRLGDSTAGTGADRGGTWGTYHFAGATPTTWCGFARRILALRAERLGVPSPPVHAIATADYPLPARRPANSVLNGGRLAERFGIAAPDWERPLAEAVKAIVG